MADSIIICHIKLWLLWRVQVCMYLWNVFDLSLWTDFFFTSSLFTLYSCFTMSINGSKTNLKLGKLRCSVLRTLYLLLLHNCRYYKYRLKYLNSYVPELYNGAECPLCPKVSMFFKLLVVFGLFLLDNSWYHAAPYLIDICATIRLIVSHFNEVMFINCWYSCTCKLLWDTYKLSRELSNLPLRNCIPSCLNNSKQVIFHFHNTSGYL